MTEIPTRDQFDEALMKISCGYTGLVLAETEEEAAYAREKYLAGRATALAAFDAQAERIAELEAKLRTAQQTLLALGVTLI